MDRNILKTRHHTATNIVPNSGKPTQDLTGNTSRNKPLSRSQQKSLRNLLKKIKRHRNKPPTKPIGITVNDNTYDQCIKNIIKGHARSSFCEIAIALGLAEEILYKESEITYSVTLSRGGDYHA
jgi:hypothetical protein